MRTAGAILLAALLFAVGARTGAGENDLARRAADVKKERKAWEESRREEAAKRAAALEALGIRGVARLGIHGDAGRSVDIAFIGDGFAAEDMDKYAGYVDEMVKNFDTPPFDVHAAHVNFHRVDLVSEQSGIKLDDNDVNPPLGGVVNPFVGGKLLRIDERKTIKYVREAVPEVDYIIAVLNTFEKFRGSANTSIIVKLSTAKGHRRSITVHEFGHNYIGLVDEYVDPKQAGKRRPPPAIDKTVNATLESNAYLAKWHHWNVPEEVFRGKVRGKPVKWQDNVRCFEGGATFPDGVYRAEENCHMQRGRGKHFCRVCTEGMELGTYRFFAPIESVEPLAAQVDIDRKSTTVFRVRPIAVRDRESSLRVSWYLDGERLPDKKSKVAALSAGWPGTAIYSYGLKGADLGEGTHVLTALVDIVTPRVHMDRGWLSSSFTWTVGVTAKGPGLVGPKKRIALAGEPMGFEARPPEGSAAGAWRLLSPPEGATYDAATGAFAWTPRPKDVGARRLVFTREGNLPSQDHAVTVTVKPAEKRGNKAPKILFLPPPDGTEGEQLQVLLQAYDADGDHLAWSSPNLPPGAELAPDTGVLSWRPGLTQRGSYGIDIEVTDGQKKAKTTLPVVVHGASLFRGMFSRGMVRLANARELSFDTDVDRMLVALHHPDPRTRAAQLDWLKRAPRQARLAQSLRLMREIHPDVSAEARVLLEGAFFEDVGAALPMFLDQVPARLWQFVDREEALGFIEAITTRAAADPATTRKQKKALAAIQKDIENIGAYNTWRRAQPPMPPITDKKYR